MTILKNTFQFIEESTVDELTEELESYGITLEKTDTFSYSSDEFHDFIETIQKSLEYYKADEVQTFSYTRLDAENYTFSIVECTYRSEAA